MRKILIFLFIISCNSNQKSLPVSLGETLDGVPFITGKINRQNLIEFEHSKWFLSEYEKYQVPVGWVKKNKKLLNEMNLKLFLGTWCEDSEREVPGMIKLLESSDFDFSKIEIYAVTEEKYTYENFEKNLNLTNVPTLIFYKNGKEINRFVEFPNISLAKDLENIIQGKKYQNPYSEIKVDE
ncbi:MAG: thiol reductase thioredoxin [Flavobacteriaceae bacterium]|jgi:thiol-disulfide isomerase/thioredoxin|nr:thiol reductase thioredoxin [Flavobacteriaceae bacterium]|tara:strand:+ start:495 stop:1040 length:546 start_codon:yes stop_codon:yes gene_type:complete